jgi:hypothetical protein
MSAVVVETRDLPECCTTQLVQTCCATLHGHTNRLTAHATVGVVAPITDLVEVVFIRLQKRIEPICCETDSSRLTMLSGESAEDEAR